MNPIWPLVKKDLRRLQWPLLLFSGLVLGKIVFYAYIGGLFRAPDIEWLRRLQNLPEFLLRFLITPVFAYVLVGWLVFEDSPSELDAHWITRPISGAQLFAAKLATAGLAFVLWPLGLNILWWVACGAGSAEVLLSAREFVLQNAALIAVGFAVAALTGGFARFALWSLVALVVFMGAQLFSITAPGLGRLVVSPLFAGLVALPIAWHQFVTRRFRKSLVLAIAGVVAFVAVCAVAPGGFGNGQRVAPESPGSAAVAVKLAGPARYLRLGRRDYAQLPVRIEHLPDRALLVMVRVTGEWRFNDTKAWTSRTERTGQASFARDAIRRQLHLPAPAEPENELTIHLPFSAAMAERAAREPAELRAEMELELGWGQVLAELPLAPAVTASRAGAYTISHLFSGSLQENRRRALQDAAPGDRYGVSVVLTERSARGLAALANGGLYATHFALVNRRTGQLFLPDNTRSGPEAISTLNQVMAKCRRLTFLVEPADIRLDELSIAVLRFERNELATRRFESNPVTFVAGQEQKKAPAVAGPAPVDQARLEAVLAARAAGDRFMGSVLLGRDGAVLWERSYGWSEMDQKAPNTADTRFRIGSLTKQFTAAAILLLAEDGRLKIDDPLGKFIPDIPESWRPITLRHLLNHTSGIPNFTNLPGFAAWRLQPRTPAQTMAMIRDLPLDFAPGEKFNYSNSGYVLLGWVIELASGRSYADFLQERIFRPLGMKDTGCDITSPPRPQHATGYVSGRGHPEPAYLTEMQGPGGAGVIYSTTQDLLRWTQGLFGGKLLSAVSLEQMTTPAKDNYAFGLGVFTRNGRKLFSHSGAIDGFNSRLDYYPEEKLTVVMLSNLAGAPLETSTLLAAVAFGQEVVMPSERKEIVVPVSVLQRYPGVYELAPGTTNTVRLAGEGLTVQLTGQRAFPIFPESERKFFLKAVDAQVEFVMDEQGKVTSLLQFQNGRTQTAPRIGDVAERKAITLSPDVLAAYVGRYELRPDTLITVTLENGQLMASAPRQPKSPLLAETDTKFFSATVDATVEFFRDSQGAVTHLVVHLGGRDQTARRLP